MASSTKAFKNDVQLNHKETKKVYHGDVCIVVMHVTISPLNSHSSNNS